MIPPLFFYQLALLGLLWLCVMLHLAWPSRGPVSARRSVEPETPVKARRKRSSEPKPFVGLTQKPPCALCQHEASHSTPPPMRPDPMSPTHRRPREVDTSRHFCPHADCDYRGWLGLGNLRANGHPSGGPWRQFHCTACDGYFPEHHGTIFHGKRMAVELIVRVLAYLAEGLGIRATARGFEVDPNTVLQWLVEAAEQLKAFSAYFLCNVHVKQLQLDELYAVLREVKDGALSDDKAIELLERSPNWVWIAMDTESKLLLVMDIGTRTLAMAQRVVHQVARLLAPDCVPLCVTDGLKDYGTALLGCVANFAQKVVKGHLPLSVGRLGGQGVEQFGRSEALVSVLHPHLSLLDHVHELNPNEGVLGGLERFKPQHGPCHPLDTSMILFHHIIQILHLADGDGRAVLLVIAFDRGFIGVTAVNGDHFGEPVAADRLL
jgi:hypothetical protein